MKRISWILIAASCIAAGLATELQADQPTSFDDLSGASSSDESASGEVTLDYQPPQWPEAPDTGALLIRLAAGTGAVLVTCVVTLVAGRRWLRGPPPAVTAGSQLQLIDTVSLGNRCAVYLVRAGRHQVVVGTDGSGMKSLVALPESFERSLAEVEIEEPSCNV
jgi:hypothetical protein